MAFETGASYMLTYFITSLFTFLGVYVGALLAFIAPEELAPGKGYLRAFMNTVLVFMVIILLYSYGASTYILILLGIAMSVFLYNTSESSPINQIAYFLLGIVFFFASANMELFIVTSSLIFIYGLPLGSLFVMRHGKKCRKTILADMLLNFSLFVIIALMTNLLAMYIGNW